MLRYTTCCLFFLGFLVLRSAAQSGGCSGNIGENIFTDGDFGSGSANIPQMNPGIAPGYTYTTFPPPNDGLYTITNNTGQWANLYSSWLQIPDNSSDPNGYMMVVNADYTPGLFYSQTVDGLCGNTSYEFSADVINLIRQSVGGHIKPNVSFLIDGVEFFTTGEILQDEQWHTYGFSFDTEVGQTSIELSLRNNAPGGIGNDLALDNISFRPCGPEALILPTNIENICEDGEPIALNATVIGDQYDDPAFQWQLSTDEGLSWNNIPGANASVYTHTELSAGYYYYRYLLANGPENLGNARCRVNSNVKVVFVVPKFYEVTDTICQGLSYLSGGNTYYVTGIYVDSLLSSIGCDSIVTLDLTVVSDSGIDAEVSVTDLGCSDVPDGEITVENILNGAPPLQVQLTDPAGMPLDFFDLPAGTFLLTITDRYGCTFEQSYTVVAPPPFRVDLGPDREILLGDLLEIKPGFTLPVQSFSWSPSDLFDCPTPCFNPAWYPTASDTLTIDAVSENGCTTSDQLAFTVIADRRVYFPNAFSPNGDGFNDHFLVFGQEPNVQMIKKLLVFNRWGGLVYEQTDLSPNDQSQGWNGTVDGKLQDGGVYVYLAEVLFLDGVTEVFSGGVSLLR